MGQWLVLNCKCESDQVMSQSRKFSLKEIATRPQYLLAWLTESTGSVASRALPLYRSLMPIEFRTQIPVSVRRALKRIFRIKDPLVRVEELRLRLCDLGFVEQALNDLVLMTESSKAVESQLAIWELAVWHANRRSREGSAAALELLDRGIGDIADTELRRREAVLRAECHATLEQVEAARGVINEALRQAQHPDLYLAAANLYTDPVKRIAHVNDALKLYSLPAVSLRPDKEVSLYDRLVVAEPFRKAQGPKISVIVPAFNAADHIDTAIEALLAQTWQNFEVLVVDDLSTDSTTEIVTAYSKQDSRVRLIRGQANRGSYFARNVALGEACGEFITTHDADDWSHPMKLEVQARHLMSNQGTVANMSQQARATSELLFHRRGSPGHYIFDNMSSLMFRREPVVQKLGYWDSVRFGADSEFIERIRLTCGRGSVASLNEVGPLSFQRQLDSSLTGSSVFGFHGFLMGARLAYHQASRSYHREAKRLRYEFPQERRPFAIPEPMRPVREVGKGEQRRFDTVLVADFRLHKKAESRILTEIEEARRQNHRVALIQMAFYAADPVEQILPIFRRLEDRGEVHFVVAGERVACDRLIVLDPRVLEYYQRFVPEVEANRVDVIADVAPVGLTTPHAASKWLDACQGNAERLFGMRGAWTLEDSTLAALLGRPQEKAKSAKAKRLMTSAIPKRR